MQRGISLAEVLVALAMVAALALGLVAAVINSTRLTETDRQLSSATFLGQKIMEQRCFKAREKASFSALDSFSPGVYAFADASNDLVYRLDVITPAEPGLKRLSVAIWEAADPGSNVPQPVGSPLVRLTTMVYSR
ncbi:MAG: hypothetical protein AMXMBFR33_70950 [Candidatus Xenobia bacterium]